MDDLQFGTRNKRGDYTPNAAAEAAPVFVWPLRPLKFLAWLPKYFLPWNVVFMALALLTWQFLTPSRETLQTLDWRWIAYLLVRNAAFVFVLYGALELRLYIKRAQGNRFKFNGTFPAEKPSDVFMFKSQNIDNMIRTFGTGVPIWTAYEVGMLYAWAHGWGPWTTFAEHPLALIALGLLIPLFHEAHFYCIHRLIHVPFLYKWVHSVHHNSVNPSPVVVAVDAPGRASALLVRRADPSGPAVASAPDALSACRSPERGPWSAISASRGSRSERTRLSIATPMSTTCTTSISK